MSGYIQELIKEGEHQQQDFKFEISDSKKIARSLVAFANTDGGRLLVGVKDNGALAGVRSDEEIHMVEAAAQLYCQPEVLFTTKEWNINGKLILEVIVPRNRKEKHKAPDKNNSYKIYVRVGDQNLLATPIMLKVWKKEKQKLPVKISITETEMQLLRYLNLHQTINLEEFLQLSGIKKRRAEAILVDFILLGIISIELTEKEARFYLNETDFMERISSFSEQASISDSSISNYHLRS
jgi:predicted HTH transcriptional regulator